MAVVLKKRRISRNPGRRRKLTPRQIKFFGTKAQKAALKRYRHVKRSRANPSFKKVKRSVRRAVRHVKRRLGLQPNIGEIITVGLNPGTKRRKKRNPMARSRKAKSHRKRLKYGGRSRKGQYKYVLNPRHHRRRRNPGRKSHYVARHRSRRNPGLASVKTGAVQVASLIGGAALTKMGVSMVANMSATLGSGIIGYVTTAVIAHVLGFAAKKVSKSQSVGTMVTLGGYTYLGLKILSDHFPSIAGYSPFSLSGMGVIGPSQQLNSFFAPAVNAGAPPAMVAAKGGMGLARRQGRVN